MNKRWPQQAVFAERVKEFCRQNDGLLTKRGAVQMGAAADLFGIHEDTLRQLMQDTTRMRPHFNTLNSIASVIGCSVFEFLDAPHDPPPPISHERWEGLSEKDRAIVVSLINEVATDDLTHAEKEFLHNSVRGLKESLLQLKKQG